MVERKLAALDPNIAQAAKDDGLMLPRTALKDGQASDFQNFIRGELPGQRPIASVPDEVATLLDASARELLLSAETAKKQFKEHPEIGASDYLLVQEMLDRGEIIKDRALHIGIVHRRDGWYYAVIKVTKTGKAVYLQSLRKTNINDIQRIRARGIVLREAS